MLDYAIRMENLTDGKEKPPFSILHGERFLLYHFYHDFWSHKPEVNDISKYVYLYELIKCQLRREMVQVNMIAGLGNFKDYDHRKSLFVDEGLTLTALKFAVQSSLENRKDGIEVRIMPQTDRDRYRKIINDEYHQCIFCQNDYFSKNELEERMSFVVHFSKSKCDINNRFSRLRGDLKRQAECLGRDVFNKVGFERLVGIDVAGAETNCRPEVYAHTYRYLRLQGIENFTYHVGEDFYDLTDGLRAIEEAVRFLHLDEKCRLGHCIALGSDAKRYYGQRYRTVIMPKQILLDNLVWLKAMTDKYQVVMSKNLEKEINDWIVKLYAEIGYHESFDILSYNRSMLMRGDEIRAFTICTSDWQSTYQDPTICNEVRADQKAKNIVNDYFQDGTVYKNGFGTSVTFKIPTGYEKVIKHVQNKLIKMIFDKEICIETNPTSNLRVGRLDRYEWHPVFRFKGVTPSRHRQLKVTVNTDDKGVFATSLEREFSLLAISLSKQKVKGNHNKWSKNSIFKYIGRLAQAGPKYRFKK